MRIARATTVLAVLALAALIAAAAPWWLRAVVFFPLALVAAIAFLEARNSVCVVGAAQGVYEDDGRAKTPMDAGDIPAIRRVALSLTAKSILLAAAATIAASLTALAR
jgi:hypothetical protein